MATITIEIGGKSHQVTVDDSFKDLTPDQQEAEIQHIAGQIGKNATSGGGTSAPSLMDKAAEIAGVDDTMLAPAVGGAIGATTGAALGPAVGSAVDLIAEGLAKKGASPADLPVEGAPKGVRNWLKEETSGPYVGGKTKEEAFTQSEEHRGKAVKQPRGSNIKIRQGALGISNQPEVIQPTLAQKAAANIINAEKVGAPGMTRRMAGMGVAGGELGNIKEELGKGNYGRAALSGLGALGGLASQSRIKPVRAVGTGLSAIVPTIQMMLPEDEDQSNINKKNGGRIQKFANLGAVKKLGAKLSPELDLGKILPSATFKAAPEQTVTDPIRNAFPGIYKRPDVIAREAAARVAPEDPMLKRLFGVTRDDLFEMSKRQGNEPGFLPGASKNPKGSAAAEAVMNPRNTQRLIDVLSEVKTNAPDLYTGMHGWYTMDPQYHRMVELMGEDKAKQMYHRLNTFGGIESPNLPVPVEFNRASAANWLAEQGRMNDWIKYGGLRDKHLIAGMPEDIVGVPGRVGHQRASESQRKFMETGAHGMDSPKAPPYIQASSVPELGFQTDLPVGDAHWSRFVGLPDVRTSKEVGASVSTPEIQQLAPWWKNEVAAPLDLESVPAQAILWGAGSPQTGVKTAIGAGKLELQAIEIAKAAARMGVSPETARDLILMGKARAGKKEGGAI